MQTSACTAALIATLACLTLAADLPAAQPADAQGMFYKARHKETGNMWDTWLYFHEGKYYLYYLANTAKGWDNISMAVSDDGAHFREIGRILQKADGVTWLGTGSTWKSPHFDQDRKFQMNFSEWRGKRQTIFFAESSDLVHWKRLGKEYEFTQDERWYQREGRWDCIYTIPRDGGGLFGYWTATPKDAVGFGFGETRDGVRWSALPPPKIEWAKVQPPKDCEAGAVGKIAGRYYLMLGVYPRMCTLVADRPEGPFRPAAKNYCFLSGNTYFSRFFPTPGGLLVTHHTIDRGGPVHFAPLKRAVVDSEGTFRLAWWEGNEKLKHAVVEVKLPAVQEGKSAVAMLGNTFDIRGGTILEGTLPVPAAAAGRAGLYLEHAKGGEAILVGPGGVTEFGPIRPDGSGFAAQDRMDREAPVGPRARFRLLLQGSLVEFYLDDYLIQCRALPEQSTGRIGLIVPPGSQGIQNLKAWQ